MKASVFLLIFAAVFLHLTLAEPNKDHDVQKKSIRPGIPRYLLRIQPFIRGKKK